MAHKEIPVGTKMKALKDNFGFEFGFAQIDSVRDILMGCEDVGSFALVPFAWPGGPVEIVSECVQFICPCSKDSDFLINFVSICLHRELLQSLSKISSPTTEIVIIV